MYSLERKFLMGCIAQSALGNIENGNWDLFMIYQMTTLRSGKEGYAALGKLSEATKALFMDELILDFSRCSFFEANLVAPLAAVLARIEADANEIKFINLSLNIGTILQKNGFLLKYGFRDIIDANSTTVRFLEVKLNEEANFAKHLSMHLTGRGLPSMSQELRKAFLQSIFEVFQNAVTHSESKFGFFVCGQYFPQLHKLDLTMADAGVGFRTQVRRRLGNKISSVAAIEWALKEGNTTKVGQRPGGLGLKFLKEFIELNNGKIQIASRLGFYEFAEKNECFHKMSGDFIGTIVNLEINTGDTKSYRLKSEISLKDIL